MNRWHLLSLTMVTVVLGVLLAVQLRSTEPPEDTTMSIDRAQVLTQELQVLAKEQNSLKAEIEDLEQAIASATQGNEQAKKALQSEIAKNKIIAGITPVVGPGVIVTLSDFPRQEPPESNPQLFAVRDVDILRVVNDLRSAGAEAIAVNGQRLISTSEIRAAGAFINVNLTPVASPYVIKAIGDPEELKNLLEMSGGLAETLRSWGIGVEIEMADRVEIPGYQGARFEYARPMAKDGRG
ncbi:MAG: DUF881 domain-containing protein [Peptococcaceae bacterium]|nr:DUF881 domain-containing protein [Peptococcaceae bacterium]